MTTYEIIDNKTGKTYEVSGDRAPTETEVDELIQSTLPKPSIEERVLANTLYTSDDTKRKAYLQALGKNPNEPGFATSPRELLADVLETGIGQGAKFVGQVGGERVGSAVGALAGSPAGPIGAGVGGVTGFIGGGAGGRAAVQAAAELYGKARGMGIDKSRIPQETVAGAVTSGLGKATTSIGKAIANTPIGKKFEEFMLTNLTRMSRPMQEWVENRWTDVSNLAKTPKEAFTKLYDKSYNSLKYLFGEQDTLGKAITQAKNDLLFPAGNKPLMAGLSKEVADAVAEYRPNITTAEAGAITRAVNILERLGGDIIEKTPSRADLAIAVQAGQITQEIADTYITREMLEAQYSKALDTVVKIGRKAKVQQSTALGNLSKEVNSLINKRVTDTSPYSTLSQKLDELGSHLSEANLKDPTKRDAAIKFLNENLFNEESIASNKAFTDTLSQYLGPGIVNNIKDLAAAHFMRSPQLLASFGKLTAVPLVTGGVGGVLGYATGGQEGARKGATIGSTLGFGAALPYASPALATLSHRFTEKVGSELVNRKAIDVLSQSFKLASSPLAAMIRDTTYRFGVEPTEEDLKVLKSRSTVLSTP